MGNRAVITTPAHKTSLYLHWNGGRDSVESFLEYCASTGVASPERDLSGWAQLAACASNFFGPGGTSVGIHTRPSRQGDNGIYVIEDWRIVAREDLPGGFIEQRPSETTPSQGDLLAANLSRPKDTPPDCESIYITSPYPVYGDKICLALASPEPVFDLAAVCRYCDVLGFADPSSNSWDYGYARLAQVLVNYLGANSVRVGNVSDFEDEMGRAGQDRVFSVGSRTIQKPYGDAGEREFWVVTDNRGNHNLNVDGYLSLVVDRDGAMTERLCEVAAAQPEDMRIPESFFRAEKVLVSELVPGDVVSIVSGLGDAPCEEHVVLGLGADRVVNGSHVAGVPIIDAFECDSPRWWSTEPRPELPDPDNPNNYLRESVYRVVDHRPDDPRIPKMAKAIEDDYQSYLARTGAISL